MSGRPIIKNPVLSSNENIHSYDMITIDNKKYIRATDGNQAHHFYLIETENGPIDESYLSDKSRWLRQDARDRGLAKGYTTTSEVVDFFKKYDFILHDLLP